MCLMGDQTEFVMAFPKSGHRLHLKRVVKSILDSPRVAAHEQLPKAPSIQDETNNVSRTVIY